LSAVVVAEVLVLSLRITAVVVVLVVCAHRCQEMHLVVGQVLKVRFLQAKVLPIL
jgi:hypothetical protein